MKTVTIRAAVLTLVISLSLINLDGEWLWKPVSADGANSASQPGVHILDSDDKGIILELYTPDFQIEPLATEEITCDRLGVTDYATNDQAGWPALPVRGAMLGIPPDADITLTVLSTNAEILPDHYNLCPVATSVVETELSGEIRFRGYQLVRDPQAYAANGLSPTSAAELVETGFIRSQRVAQLRFHPFQYNPASGELRHLERIQVRLDFNRTYSYPLDANAIRAIDEGVFEETLSNTLLNYDAARWWRTRPAPLDRQAQIDWPLPAQTEPSYKITIDEDGIYEVSYADLQAAGIATTTLDSLDPRTFQLHNQGQEVAIYIEGETDGSFDQADYILFYGQKINTKYTDTNVYWLTWGDENGHRMPTLDGTPTGTAPTPQYFLSRQPLEENHTYQSKRPSGPNNDHWYWEYVLAVYNPSGSSLNTSEYTTTLQHIAQGPISATVRGLLRSYTGVPNHHTQIYLNGHLIDEATWLPETEYWLSTSVPPSYLLEGTNTISMVVGLDITTSGDYDAVFINWFEIEYPKTHTATNDLLFFGQEQPGTWEFQASGFSTHTLDAFDVTNPLSPARILSATILSDSGVYTLTFQHTITGEHHYLALAPSQRRIPIQIELDNPSTLLSTDNGADYIIITYGDFYTSVLPLASYRSNQGLRVKVIDVQDAYDEFNYGILSPQAIYNLLAYAYANWTPPAPTYVLLVGDSTYDFRDYLGQGMSVYVPPYLADADPWLGETAADNRYVCVSGSDVLPDMHIGRLPVSSSEEAGEVVSKILGYEQNPPDGEWKQRTLFVADNPDSAGNFYTLSDDIADHYVPAPYETDKVYYGLTHTTASEARDATVSAINEGRLVVNYIGHAWRDWASERILQVSDISALTNTERLPLVVSMTCMNGYFISHQYAPLSEAIVRASGKGAIAAWAPTGLGIATGHDYLNRGLFEALFFDGVARLGPATTQGKLYLYSHTSGYRDLLDTYVLLGDPGLALNVLEADISITKTVDAPEIVYPGDTITYTLIYTNTGPATAHHVVITDVLPSELVSPTITSSGAAIAPRLGSRFVWDVDDLGAGEGGVITVTVAIDAAFVGSIHNAASIATTAIESRVDNNADMAAVTVKVYVYYFPIVAKSSPIW